MVFCNVEIIFIQFQASGVTILILIDGFLQYNKEDRTLNRYNVTILILIDGFLQLTLKDLHCSLNDVTILILIDGFLQ